MACSALKRTCGPFPANVSMQNVSVTGIVEDATGILIQWDENDTRGATHLAVLNLRTSERIDYKVVDFLAPAASVYLALPETDVYSITYWKEDESERSPIGNEEYTFLEGVTAPQVVHNGVGVLHVGELVLHTRQQIYLVQEGTISDYLLTEQSGFTISG